MAVVAVTTARRSQLIPESHERSDVRTRTGLFLAVAAAVSFHLAFLFPWLNCLVLLYAFLLVTLSRVPSSRVAFRLGFLSGICVFGPQLAWFWRIFGPASLCLWAVLAVFTGLFVFLVHLCRRSFGQQWLWIFIPVLWTGLEYFRSELYFLRFSWLSAGYVFSGPSSLLPVGYLGVYGSGFAVFLLAAFIDGTHGRRSKRFFLTVVVIATLGAIPSPAHSHGPGTPVHVAGIQLEFPAELKVPSYLDRALADRSDAQLFVLSEYTFDGEVPGRVRDWCRTNKKYLIAGGKKDAGPLGQYYNTAFVVGPTGDILFEQPKSVPIQFFKDGLPAVDQKLWHSPWGKIAICVCYDLSYRAVVDRFVRQGAQAIIVPFMDVTDWGAHQHTLHSKVGPLRAQEYRLPIFRLGSSGISQVIDPTGRIQATASFPAQEQIIAGILSLATPGRLPLDTFFAPVCVFATGLILGWLLVAHFRAFRYSRSEKNSRVRCEQDL